MDSDNSENSGWIPEMPEGFRKSIRLCILVGMFADYKCLVVQDYKKKRMENILPSALARPSPARLKRECTRVCSERFDRRDEKTLKDFFEQAGDRVASLHAIDRFDIGRFKPLANFLKGTTNNPDDKIVELLAWLIDFTPRPHEYGRKYPPCIGGAGGGEAAITPPALTVEETTPKSKKRKAVVTGLLSVLAVIGFYWLIYKTSSGPHACMYWVGDHYQPIPCTQKSGDALVIPLDSGKIAHFKKINRPDTITENALGSIWYVNFQGVYECYTSPGFHPIDTNLKLRPLTGFVLLKHIHPSLEPAQLAPSR